MFASVTGSGTEDSGWFSRTVIEFISPVYIHMTCPCDHMTYSLILLTRTVLYCAEYRIAYPAGRLRDRSRAQCRVSS